MGGSTLVVLDTCALTFSLVALLLSGGGGELLEIICDPLWEKVPFGANIDFPLCAYIAKGFGK